MARRPTINDVAAAAGVSVATVDRVLSGRAKVREETARRVLEAAAGIGFHNAPAIRARVLSHVPEVSIGIVLQKERHAFYQALAETLLEVARAETQRRYRLTIRFARGQSPADFAEAIAAMVGKVQAVAATGVDHHEVTAAVQGLRARGIPTFALLSDFAQGLREGYLGTNNLKAGRSAAWLMHRVARPRGKVAVFIGGHRFHGHDLRETGFRSYFREFAPEAELLDTLINLETRQLTYEATMDLAARHPDLAGVYVAGGGMEGAIAAAREIDRGLGLVVHELTPESRQGLLDGTVLALLATPLPQLATDLLSAVGHVLEHGMSDAPGQRFLSPLIVTPESL